MCDFQFEFRTSFNLNDKKLTFRKKLFDTLDSHILQNVKLYNSSVNNNNEVWPFKV